MFVCNACGWHVLHVNATQSALFMRWWRCALIYSVHAASVHCQRFMSAGAAGTRDCRATVGLVV